MPIRARLVPTIRLRHRVCRALRGAILAPVVLGSLAVSGWAADPPSDETKRRLQQVQEELRRAEDRRRDLESEANKIAEEERQLQQMLINAGKKAQDHETSLTQLEQALASLARDEAAKDKALAQRRALLSDTSAALLRLERQPPHAALANFPSAIDFIRAAVALKVAVPRIEKDARKLGDELAGLRALRQELGQKRSEATRVARSLEDERTGLQGMLARRTRMRQETSAQQQALAEEAGRASAQARDLTDLIGRFEARSAEQARRAAEAEEQARRAALRQARRPPPATTTPAPSSGDPPDELQTAAALPAPTVLPQGRSTAQLRLFPKKAGGLFQPAAGRPVRGFGDAVTSGGASRGAEFRTRPAALVVAPFDGQVMFAGPFRGYGRILILEHAGGYHTLLSGMERIDAAIGSVVLAGEPVGFMGPAATEADDSGPRLYVELRRQGRPIDPIPWLTERSEKVTG